MNDLMKNLQNLTHEQEMIIFYKKLFEYCKSDIVERLEEKLLEEEDFLFIQRISELREMDIENITRHYIDKHDCNIDDNSQYERAINVYLRGEY